MILVLWYGQVDMFGSWFSATALAGSFLVSLPSHSLCSGHSPS